MAAVDEWGGMRLHGVPPLTVNRTMRRFLSWHLPLLSGLAFAIVLGWGFVLGVRGDVGKPVVGGAPAISPGRGPDAGPMRILILGDSLARGLGDVSGLGIGGDLARDLDEAHRPHRPIVNLGVAGAKTTDLLKEIERPGLLELVSQSGVVIVSIGGNDLNGEDRKGPPPEADRIMDAVLGRVEKIVATLRGVNPRGRIFLIGLYNPFRGSPDGKSIGVSVNKWNAKLGAAFAADPNLTIVQTADLFVSKDRLGPDRFHPDAEAYRIIARRIAEAL